MKKIVIFGSTGSIGTSLLNIIKKDKKNFKIQLISANKNYKKLIKQAKFFNVKNLIITDQNSFLKAKASPSSAMGRGEEPVVSTVIPLTREGLISEVFKTALIVFSNPSI